MTEIFTIESENISKTETETISHYETVEHSNNENGSVSRKLIERKARNSESSSTDNSLEDSPKIAPSDSYYFYQGTHIFQRCFQKRTLRNSPHSQSFFVCLLISVGFFLV